MKIGFYLAHPGHFHLFKNVIKAISKDHEILVLYNQKDVLEELITTSGISHLSQKVKTNTKVKGKLSLIWQFVLKNWGAYRHFRKFKPDVVFGTPVLISLIGQFLKYDSIIVNEDDFDIIEKTANLGYPKATRIICPRVCRTGAFNEKCIKHDSYHELAYLHPDHFEPDQSIVDKYFTGDENYGIIRFAKLSAHHDDGIRGISDETALHIIQLLEPHMKVVITSERELSQKLEPYRISISPKDMHHVMAGANLYIGDSQTMAAEAGVLGIPFIRYNDFVGRISYLEELETTYGLGYGVKPGSEEKLLNTLRHLMAQKDLREQWQEKRNNMLSDKIDFAQFLIRFIEGYPDNI